MDLHLTFESSGSAHCLYSELIPLSEVGQLQITRASHIEFNNREQVWEVRSLSGELLFQHASRTECLNWEAAHLQPSSTL